MAILLDMKIFKIVYDSLVILKIEKAESAKRLLHSLYLSNIDTNIYFGEKDMPEMDQSGFIQAMNKTKGIKHPDIIRLYNLLCKVNRNINMICITETQRSHVKRLREIIRNMETRHYKQYGREIFEDAPITRHVNRHYKVTAIQR